MCGRAKLETDVCQIKIAFRIPPPNFPPWFEPRRTCRSIGRQAGTEPRSLTSNQDLSSQKCKKLMEFPISQGGRPTQIRLLRTT